MVSKEERDLLKKMYPSKKWENRVDKMSNSQVAAIFQRLREQKKI